MEMNPEGPPDHGSRSRKTLRNKKMVFFSYSRAQ